MLDGLKRPGAKKENLIMEFKESIEAFIGQLRRYGQRHKTTRFESHLKNLEQSTARELASDEQATPIIIGAKILVFPCASSTEAARLCRTISREA